MRLIKRLTNELHGLGESDSIKNFETFMLESTKVMDALRRGVRLDSIEFKRFSPAMRAGIVKALPDLERAMCEALDSQELPLEVTSQLILIYLDAGTRELLTPTLTELVEKILELARDGRLTVAAE